MAAASFSARVNVEQSRKQAKDLVRAFRAGAPDALDRIRWNHPRFRGLTDSQIRQRKFLLADAQLVIARLHCFESWPRLLRHIETLSRRDPLVMRFEAAADAIIAGDAATLGDLLRLHPDLVRQRSTREHHAPLLHYLAANGVEDYRQRSPSNAVAIAKLLLDAGAEVDAASDAYGGGSTALGLVATSTPPRHAGVQLPLIDLLLERGAAIDGVRPGSNIVLAALANNCPEAAQRLAERGARADDIVAAAGLGMTALVRQLAGGAAPDRLERALIMAARYGRRAVAEYLLDLGVDAGALHEMTALHWAAGAGRLDLVDLLIARGAPLEARNAYGGTVLDGLLWFAFNADPRDPSAKAHAEVIDRLIAAGARTDVYPDMRGYIDEVYRRGGREAR